MLRLLTLLLLSCASVAHAQDQIRWRGYPAPRSGVAVLDLDGTGRVTRVRMRKSTGDTRLDRIAVRRFSQWRLKPGTRSPLTVPITFASTGSQL
jgi:TonB family protein